MPQAMSAKMALFFGGFVPFMCLLWTLDAFLAYRQLYREVFYITVIKKPAPSLACLLLVILFITLPVRTLLNKVFTTDSTTTFTTYKESQTRFLNDYDMMNPVTRTEGLVRNWNAHLSLAGSEEEKKNLQQQIRAVKQGTVAQNFQAYQPLRL